MLIMINGDNKMNMTSYMQDCQPHTSSNMENMTSLQKRLTTRCIKAKFPGSVGGRGTYITLYQKQRVTFQIFSSHSGVYDKYR